MKTINKSLKNKYQKVINSINVCDKSYQIMMKIYQGDGSPLLGRLARRIFQAEISFEQKPM